MDVALARQCHKKLSELLSELQNADSVEKREPVVLRMQNLVGPLYVVHSGAVQHIEEALRRLRHPDLALVNAAHHTISGALQQIFETIEKHGEQHFIVHGEQRLYAKPVEELELRSLVEKNRLFEHDHRPYVRVLEVGAPLDEVFTSVEAQTLRPVLHRMGFPQAQALVFFRTHALPSTSVPAENLPSVRIAKLRSGVPITVVKHRVF